MTRAASLPPPAFLLTPSILPAEGVLPPPRPSALSACPSTPVPSALQSAKPSDSSDPLRSSSLHSLAELIHNTVGLVTPAPCVFASHWITPTCRKSPRSRLYSRGPAQCLPNVTNVEMRPREGWLETLTSGTAFAAAPERTTLTPCP